MIIDIEYYIYEYIFICKCYAYKYTRILLRAVEMCC